MDIVLFTADLAATSRVAAVAGTIGALAKVAMNAAKLRELASGGDLVIIDLGMAGMNVAETVGSLRALEPPPRRIVAFGPHVHDSALAAAHSAGCDDVFTRGQFFSRLDEVLRAGQPTP